MLMKELHLLQRSARKFEQTHSRSQWHHIDMQLAEHDMKQPIVALTCFEALCSYSGANTATSDLVKAASKWADPDDSHIRKRLCHSCTCHAYHGLLRAGPCLKLA